MPSPLLKTTLSLLGLQVISRMISFALNQLLLRFTTPQALGVATMSFEVLRDTSLFLIREGIRGAVLRTRSSSSTTSKLQFSQSLLIPTLLSPLLLLLFAVFGVYSSQEHAAAPHYNSTLSLYAVSGLLELLAERWYLTTLVNWESLTSARVRVEGVAVGIKSLAMLATIYIGGEQAALLSFGVGQGFYGATLFVGLWAAVGRRDRQPWRIERIHGTEDKQGSYFDAEITKTTWALTKQSIVKQLLTEGDKIVVSRISSVEDQGGYAVALNYGSLVARILFQPLEESSRLFFSRKLASPTKETLESTSSLLSSILLLHTHLSLIFILLAPSYTSALLYHLLGPRWSVPLSSAPIILRAYCTYLPFMAINGITEAFYQSVATDKWLKRGSYWMALCSLVFLAAVFVCARAGMAETGLIYANCVNMTLRIAFSSVFVRRYYTAQQAGPNVWRNLSLKNWTPRVSTLAVFGSSCVVVRWSEGRNEWKTLRGFGQHLAIGAVAGTACLAVIGVSERHNLGRLRALATRRKVD